MSGIIRYSKSSQHMKTEPSMDLDQISRSLEPDHLWHEANHHPDPRLKERQQYDSLMQEWKSQIEEKKSRKPMHITLKPSQTKVAYFLPHHLPPQGIQFGSPNRRSYHNLSRDLNHRPSLGSPDMGSP